MRGVWRWVRSAGLSVATGYIITLSRIWVAPHPAYTMLGSVPILFVLFVALDEIDIQREQKRRR